MNQIAPQLLIELSLPLLEKRSGRIVMIGSKQANKYFDENNFEKYSKSSTITSGLFQMSKVEAYMNSKLMNSIYTIALAEYLQRNHSNVTINIAFPGLTQTNICRDTALFSQFLWKILGFIFFKYPVEGMSSCGSLVSPHSSRH